MAVIDKFTEVFDADIYEGYGLSETAPVADVQPAGLRSQARHGRPSHLGRRRRDRARGRRGRDRAAASRRARRSRHPRAQHHDRYLNNPEPLRRPSSRLVSIGRLGTKDEDGFVRIVDRKKDMVLRGGFNVYPREVEEILARHPAVAQVAVIGLPDPT